MLALVALTTAAVLPATWRWQQAAAQRGWEEDTVAVLTGLPLRAFSEGRPLMLDAAHLRALLPDLPDAVELRLSQPLSYTADGAAEGADIELRRDKQVLAHWRIEPISGRLLK